MTILANRVISVFDKKTSMRLTKSEWTILDNICMRENIKRKRLLEMIETHKDPKLGLTPSVRLFSLLYLSSIASKIPVNYPFCNGTETIEETLQELSR